MAGLIPFIDASFPKKGYLRQKSEFTYVHSHGVTCVGKLMVLKVADSLDHKTRIGVVASKKCHKSAVKRNRARRLLKESFRLLANRITSPLWIVIIARRKIVDRRLPDVQQELVGLLVDANAFSIKTNS